MEHLLLPHDATIIPNQISYICSEPYDGGDFLTYPLRLVPPRENLLPNFMKDSTRWQNVLREIHAGELEKIIQSWLLFGLIYELLGVELSKDAVCVVTGSENPGSAYVSTAGLYPAVANWINKTRANLAHLDDAESRYLSLTDCLWHVNNCLSAIVSFRIFEGPKSTKLVESSLRSDRMLICSVASIAEVLARAVDRAFNRGENSKSGIGFGGYNNVLLSWESMSSNGWCPSEIPPIKEGFASFASYYYITHMKQPSQVGDHVSCNENRCVSVQKQVEGGYKISHRTHGCACRMVGVNKDDLANAFEGDSHAVFRIIEGDIPQIHIVAADSQTAYVAISHVWADGLGNPYHNAMPECQLRYLAEVTKMFKIMLVHSGAIAEQTELYLFIDTLLFPTGDENLDLKKNALGKMARIYRNASCVLILDKALAAYRLDMLDNLEALVRLCTSRWSSRLWTLQEGAFAQSLFVQFEDCIASFGKLIQEVREQYDSFQPQASVAVDVLAIQFNVRRWTRTQKGATSPFHPLVSLSHSLWSRQCSVIEDEPLCLAALLGLDVNSVAQAAPADRSQAMWQSLDTSSIGIPPEIITYTTPRMSSAGFRWAPSSLLRMGGCKSRYTPQYSDLKAVRGRVTSKGLHVQFPGFQICLPQQFVVPDNLKYTAIRSTDLLFIRDTTGMWYRSLAVYKTANAAAGVEFTFGDLLQRSIPQAVVLAAGNQTGVVQTGENQTTVVQTGQNVVQYGVYGASIQDFEEQIIIQTECILAIDPVSPRQQYLFASADNCADEVRHSSELKTPVAAAAAANDLVDLTTPENTDYVARTIALSRALANDRLAADQVLASSANSLGINGADLYLLCILRCLWGGFGIIEKAYPSTQNWIVD